MKISEENNIIKKSNDLINSQIKKLDVSSLRIVSLAIAQITTKDKSFQMQRIPVNKIINKSGSLYRKKINEFGKEEKLIDVITDNLMNKIIKVPLEDGGWLKYPFLDRCKYIPNKGFIEIRFSEDMKKFLLDLKGNFTKLNLEIIMRITSSYSIRLYEILKQYFQKDYYYKEFLLEDLYNHLGVKKSYRLWSKFKKRVLEVAQKNFKSHTDIVFTFEPYRKYGRSFTHIKFTFSKNEDYKQLDLPFDKETKVIEDESLSFNLKNELKLNQKQINEIITIRKEINGKHWKTWIEEKLVELKKTDISKKSSKYFYKCLINEKYGDPVGYSEAIKNVKDKKEIDKRNDEKELDKKIVASKETKIDNLTEKQKRDFKIFIENNATNSFNKKWNRSNQRIFIDLFIENIKKLNKSELKPISKILEIELKN
ncbi:MAG: replication initiation protein [Desulfobacterales bacterium]|nr:replication initiation protein [Desulfobacterales bacterium]